MPGQAIVLLDIVQEIAALGADALAFQGASAGAGLGVQQAIEVPTLLAIGENGAGVVLAISDPVLAIIGALAIIRFCLRHLQVGCERMSDASRVAAAINLRVRQLEAQGISGPTLVDHMLGHMQDLQRIYDTVSDGVLRDLCRRFPGFHRYASLMEAMSEKNQQMIATGTHPYADLPALPEPLKTSLTKLLRGGVELEREFQAAVDADRAAQAGRLTAMRRQWAADLEQLVGDFRSSNLPLRSQALVQRVVKAVAERIERMARE